MDLTKGEMMKLRPQELVNQTTAIRDLGTAAISEAGSSRTRRERRPRGRAHTVRRDGTNVTLSWPEAEQGWRLESSVEPGG